MSASGQRDSNTEHMSIHAVAYGHRIVVPGHAQSHPTGEQRSTSLFVSGGAQEINVISPLNWRNRR
jgi:hypothetical protein